MTQAITHTTVDLPDGRVLSYSDLADAGGAPLLFFHGTPGSRLAFAPGDAQANTPGLRLITIDRPGYGGSDPHPGRTLLTWADDVAAVADHLKLGTFAVAGESGGGPYAAACGYRFPARVTAVGLLASPSPRGVPGAAKGLALGNRLGLWLGRIAPWLMRRLMAANGRLFQRDPERFLDALARQVGPADAALFEKPGFRQALIREVREAYRQGAAGHVHDAELAMAQPSWGFDVAALSVPVHLWYGDQDRLVSPAMTAWLAAQIPECRVHSAAGRGHFLTEDPEIWQQLVAMVRQASAAGGAGSSDEGRPADA